VTSELVSRSYPSPSAFALAERGLAVDRPFSMSITSVDSSGDEGNVEGRRDSGDGGDG
jgi:hypothetical protein